MPPLGHARLSLLIRLRETDVDEEARVDDAAQGALRYQGRQKICLDGRRSSQPIDRFPPQCVDASVDKPRSAFVLLGTLLTESDYVGSVERDPSISRRVRYPAECDGYELVRVEQSLFEPGQRSVEQRVAIEQEEALLELIAHER